MRRLVVLVSLLVTLDLALWSAVIPLLPHYRHALGLTKVETGWVLAGFSVAIVVVSIPAGHLADRLGPRRVTALGTALMIASTVALGFAGSFWVLLAARLLQGAADAVVWTAGIAWVAARAPASERGRSVSFSNAAAALGVIIGPIVGGVATSAIGIRGTFTLTAVLMAGLLAWVLVEPDARLGADRQRGLRAALRVSLGESLIAASVAMLLVVSVVGGALQVLVPLHLAALGMTRSGIGAAYSTGAVLGAIAILATGRLGDRVGRVPLAAAACAALGLATAAFTLPLTLAAFVAVAIFSSPVQSVLYAVGYPLSADGADRARLGHGMVLGVVNLAWGIGAIVGPLAGSRIAQSAGDRASYAVLAAVSIASAALMVRVGRSGAIAS